MRARGGRRAKSKPSPQTSTRSVASSNGGAAVGQRREQRARRRGVRVLVGADQEVVLDRARPAAARQSRLTNAVKRSPSACVERLRAPRSSPSSTPAPRGRFAPPIRRRAASIAASSSTGSPLLHRLLGARALEDLREVAPLVADPRSVDRRIFERRHALDRDVLPRVERVELPFRLAMPDLHRAAARAARADRRRRLQVPDARLVEEVARQQRADRADVDDVVGIRVVVERAVLGGANQRDVAALLRCRARATSLISCVKRTQREHRMQRSLSSTMRSERSWNLVARTFGSTRDRRLRRCTCSGSPAACIRRPCRRCRSRPGDSAAMSCSIDLRCSRTRSESVSTRKPSVTGMLQAISTQLRPSTCTTQTRQLPAIESAGW